MGWRIPFLAFEPNPETFKLFQHGLEVNGLTDSVRSFELACSDVAGSATFHMTPAQTGASSLLTEAVHREFIVRSDEVTVRTVRLDDILASSSTEAFVLKIDAEGADFKVLDGMGRLLHERICIGLIEFFPMILASYVDSVQYLKKFSENYVLFDESGNKLRQLGSSVEDLQRYVSEVESRKPLGAGDIFFVPKALPECDTFIKRLLDN